MTDRIKFSLSTSLFVDVLFLVFSLAVPIVTILALVYPPPDISQGQAHRIFYIHVPVAWAALYAPLISAVSAILYLKTKKEIFDIWSYTSAKIAFIFSLGVVISGPIWASTEWGTYWNWSDSRLMSFFVLLMSLGGYFIVRYLTDDPRSKSTFSSILSIISSLAALMTWFAIRLITPLSHPESVLGNMAPEIKQTFYISVLGYHLFFILLMRISLRQEKIKRIYLTEAAYDHE